MKTLIINYKAYREGIDSCLDIARTAHEAALGHGVDVITAVPFTLCKEAASAGKAIAQGMDTVEPGAATGHVSWYEIQKAGCIGSLINHAENRIAAEEVRRTVEICRANSLLSYVCVANMEEAREVSQMNPTAISYEPVELIGSAMKGGASVATADASAVKKFTDLVHGYSGSLALIGAGIKNADDVRKSVELGSDGILVSSVVMKGDFRSKIDELAGSLVG